AAKVDDVALGQRLVLADDKDLGDLAGMFVRHADDGSLQHSWMGGDDILDLVRVDVEARDQDHILLAIDNADKAALIHLSHVAGLEIAVRREAVGCFLRLLPIALHDLRSSYAEFANCADPEALAIFIADDHIRGWDRDADGSAELLVTEAICGNDGRDRKSTRLNSSHVK